jgi:nucleotide-binding universal stress UspA family protein
VQNCLEVRFKNILCAMDFSPSALQAFGFALDLARQADGAVTVLNVVEWLPEDEPRVFARFDAPAYRQQLLDDADGRARRTVSRLDGRIAESEPDGLTEGVAMQRLKEARELLRLMSLS